MKRKLLSLTLVLALVLSLVPMGAFAAAVTGITFSNSGATVGTFAGNGALAVFTPAAAQQNGAKVKLTFPAGTVINDTAGIILPAEITAVQADGNAAGAAGGAVTAVTAVTASAANRTLELTLANATWDDSFTGAVTIALAGLEGDEIKWPTATTTTGTFTVETDKTADGTYEDTGSIATVAFVAAAANQFTSVVSVDKTTITADGTSTAEFTVYTYDALNNIKSADVYYASSRSTTDTFAVTTGTPGAAGNAQGMVTTDANGKAVVTVATAAAGSFKVGFGLANPAVADGLVKYLTGATDATNVNATALKIIGTKDITVGSASFSTIAQFGTATASPASPKANNLDYFEYSFKVTTAAGAPVSGQKVTFTASDSSVVFSATEKTTDASGIVKVKVYATKNGSYNIEARANDKTTGLISVTFGENGVSDLSMTTAQDQKLALDVTNEYFTFKLTDGLANTVKVTSLNAAASTYTTEKHTADINGNAANKVTAEVTTQPTGSALKVKFGFSSSGNLRVYLDEFKKEGNYVMRVNLENGKKVDVKFTVVKQGTVTKLDFMYDEAIIPYNTTIAATGGVADNMTLDRIDAAGVKKSVSLTDSNIVFTSSDSDLVSVNNGGVLTTKNDDKAVGKKATITVTDKFNNLVATYEVTVGGKLAGIKLGEVKTAKVGTNAPIEVSFIDGAGNVLSSATTNTVSATGVVLEKPAGAIVGFSTAGNFSNLMKAAGKANVDVTSNMAGTVKVQILVTEGTKTYASVATITFGAADVVAAKSLVLTIGSKTGFMNNNAVASDLAPFIKDGRAFVPVSFIAAQLGGTAEFTKNAAGLVDTVTVKVGTTTVTMTIGSTTIKVVKDGKESTVTTDVAPFIQSGRTVLPFRAVAEAFGATVSFGPETGAVEWVKFQM